MNSSYPDLIFIGKSTNLEYCMKLFVPFKSRIFIISLFAVLQSCVFQNKTEDSTTKVAEQEPKLEVGDTLQIEKAPLKVPLWKPYNDSAQVAQNATHEKEKMRFKFVQSKVTNKNTVFQPLYTAVSAFPKSRYEYMRPLVLEQNIPQIQQYIKQKKFTYEELVLFYLYRIYHYELPNNTTLNTILALNVNVIEQAKALDSNAEGKHPIYGMPILLKDNIGAYPMPTTAGAVALKNNIAEDAFIVERLKENGALILGKVNLSEWANFLCNCPNGQSAIGGQTLNPYHRFEFDTGGSSAGSGAAVAANYAVAAVGTETSGSILSPSGQHSVVGMKPTVGLLSRSGIVPISSTLDTPGPMTKNVIDNGILLDAMLGFDIEDDKSVKVDWAEQWYKKSTDGLTTMRIGVYNNYLKDSLYQKTVSLLEKEGIKLTYLEKNKVSFEGFLSVLNIDMKHDLPKYLSAAIKDTAAIPFKSVEDVVEFNKQDSLVRIPYGQILFEGILADTIGDDYIKVVKNRLRTKARAALNDPMLANQLDAVLSINNYDAGIAALAEFPALGVPMGYRASGEPVNITVIAKQYQEEKLYTIGTALEALLKARKIPEAYSE